MSELPSYSSIFSMGHRATEPLVTYPDLIVEEKVDGSQFTFGVIDGELKIRSKGAIMQVEAPMKMFNLAAQTVAVLGDKLLANVIYRAEYLSKPKHNINKYTRIPEGGVIVFDIHTIGGEFLDPYNKRIEAERLGLECVPVLYRGPYDLELLRGLLDRESCLGGVKIEGLVIKPAGYDLYGTDKKVLLGKYVSDDFKERHRLEWKADNPSQTGIVQAIAAALKTEARWNKSIQHLRDAGQLTGTPRDIGPLVKELKDDLRREEYDDVAAALVRHFWDDIQRQAIRGFPEFYKAQLATDQVAEPIEPLDPDNTPAWRLHRA